MLCSNCGHDERAHNESTERCCAPECRCSQFIDVEDLIEEICEDCDCDEEESYVEFRIKIPRAHVSSFIEWLTRHSPDDLPQEPMEIPDTIQPVDLNLDDPETRKWLAEKIRSKN